MGGQVEAAFEDQARRDIEGFEEGDHRPGRRRGRCHRQGAPLEPFVALPPAYTQGALAVETGVLEQPHIYHAVAGDAVVVYQQAIGGGEETREVGVAP